MLSNSVLSTTGVGVAMVNIAIYAYCGNVFKKRRPLVNNILSAGPAISMIPFVLQLWIDQLGRKYSLVLLAALVALTLPLVAIMRLTESRFPSKVFSVD